MNFQSNQAKEPIPVAQSVIDDLVQGVTPANINNLFITARQLVSAIEEPVAFMTRSEIEAILRREKEKASVSSICLDVKPSYAVEFASKPSGWGILLTNFKSLMEEDVT